MSGVLVRGGGPGMSNPDPGGGGLREKSGAGGGGPAIEGEKSEGTSGGIVIGNGCSIGPGAPETNMKGILTFKHHFCLFVCSISFRVLRSTFRREEEYKKRRAIFSFSIHNIHKNIKKITTLNTGEVCLQLQWWMGFYFFLGGGGYMKFCWERLADRYGRGR